MHVYQMRSSVQAVINATQERMQVCMNALKEVSKVWLVAKMVHTLFESILGNKMLEERLHKAAGKKHKKQRIHQHPAVDQEEQQPPRKYEEFDLGFNNGPPAPQVSYERSRPQTPAVTPSRDVGPPAPVTSMAPPSDTYLGTGNSRPTTRPPTPFNPSYSMPASPPDLFLVTRDSSHISSRSWENFQPDQLFPDGTQVLSQYQNNPQPNLDPQLQMPNLQSQSMLHPPMQISHHHIPQRSMRTSQDSQVNMGAAQDMSTINSHMQAMPQQQYPNTWQGQYMPDGQSSDDNWSNSSRGQQVVPATLNVEDWYNITFAVVFCKWANEWRL